MYSSDAANNTLVDSERPNCPSNDGLQINLCSEPLDPQQL